MDTNQKVASTKVFCDDNIAIVTNLTIWFILTLTST